jgi:hypothetical protein
LHQADLPLGPHQPLILHHLLDERSKVCPSQDQPEPIDPNARDIEQIAYNPVHPLGRANGALLKLLYPHKPLPALAWQISIGDGQSAELPCRHLK